MAQAQRQQSLTRAGRVRGLRGARWLVAACETKLLLLEVGGEAVREVPRAVLDGKAPTQLALLLNVSPLLLGGPPLIITRLRTPEHPHLCDAQGS